METPKPKLILMTAFEPSGDALGAMATHGLKELNPHCRVVGLGGDLMASAGVELLAKTTQEAAMGVGAVSEISRIKKLIEVVGQWIEENKPDVVVAVDSPAANWPVCKVARTHGCNVVHLAAPKLWAWAPWRIKKLRRLSDHLMCLLPFEPEWFGQRDMPATFIGHPALRKSESKHIALPDGEPNIILLPGSRKSEIRKNLPMQQEILKRICAEFPGTEAVIAVRAEDVERVKPYANGLQIVADELPSVLEWGTLALTVSGTVSLHVMNYGVPMIGMYKVNPISILGAKIMLNTKFCFLPNLIAGQSIVPECIPCGNIVSQLASLSIDLLHNPEALARMRARLQKEAAVYLEHDPGKESAEIILRFASK